MRTLWDALDAFLQEHRRCGELDTGVENGRVWMTCDGCGAALSPGGDMSNHPDVEYRGCTIEVQSYGSDGDRWRPKAVVAVYDRGAVRLNTVNAPIDRLFETETEADAYSLAMAKKWIDDRV